eukprot:CAMPEP_0113607284 /NCGR_PEP_ID=MMETSP0017_2-20120614/3303_1 /TAXON_ID=2856 /ORGANISM="Cylindrotheca closterium" /LENGTH=137 /DNA_ID=CAMNT_0000515879 /DNA_START=71 /DNA_END=484 /DNA_ORIENTATION=- /assembly_acc=CAM_ASM_000147
MLRILFKANAGVSSAFGLAFIVASDTFFGPLGMNCLTGTSSDDALKALAFAWGFGMQPWLAMTQFTISDETKTPLDLTITLGKITSLWWTACGLSFLKFQEKNAFLLFNVVFMVGYGALYGYYSFVDPPKEGDEKKD